MLPNPPRVFRRLLPWVMRLLPWAMALSLGGSAWAGPNTPAPSPVPPQTAPSAPAPTPSAVNPPPAPASAPPPAPTASAAATRPAIPDYGGRDGSLGNALDGGGVGAAAPDPVAQAGRAFEALAIVLVAVGGGLVLLKRSGLLKGDGAARGGPVWTARRGTRRPEAGGADGEGLTEMLALLGSQTLPHSPGAGLHLVSVGGRVLLLGATAQSVTLLTEVAEVASTADREREMPEEVAAFADYLARVGVPPPGTGASPATLSAATDRLQSLLTHGQGRGARD